MKSIPIKSTIFAEEEPRSMTGKVYYNGASLIEPNSGKFIQHLLTLTGAISISLSGTLNSHKNEKICMHLILQPYA